MDYKELQEIAKAYASKEIYLDIPCDKWDDVDEERYNAFIEGFKEAIKYFKIKAGNVNEA